MAISKQNNNLAMLQKALKLNPNQFQIAFQFSVFCLENPYRNSIQEFTTPTFTHHTKRKKTVVDLQGNTKCCCGPAALWRQC